MINVLKDIQSVVKCDPLWPVVFLILLILVFIN